MQVKYVDIGQEEEEAARAAKKGKKRLVYITISYTYV